MRHEFGPREAREVAIENSFGFVDIASTATIEPIAVREERLALHRTRLEVKGFEIEYIGLNGIDEHGRLNGAVIFDPDDLQGAFDELDRRFVRAREVTSATSSSSTPS